MASSGGRNVIVGAFFVAAVAMALVVTVVLGDLASALAPRTRYVVRFALTDNAGLLAPGAQVRAGGMKVGSVAKVRLAGLEGGGLAEAVEVAIDVDRSLVLAADAVVRLEVPLLGTGAW
ncbi:MAG: hypothetical protein KatS3mg103_1091 [Phycisphaerales bacterium]|nr:MAG: hypothetical protein KatS3mg103_1091 [Phycisphaerales bacterium]